MVRVISRARGIFVSKLSVKINLKGILLEFEKKEKESISSKSKGHAKKNS